MEQSILSLQRCRLLDQEPLRTLKVQVHNAAREGKLQRIKDLLMKQPAQTAKDLLEVIVGGATPLIVASRYGHLAVVEWLVSVMRVNIEQVGSVTFDGETIDGAGPLWCAAAAGQIVVVKYLVRTGAMVNATTATNSTPLRAACFDGHFEIVKYLVENEADIEIANRHGHTCLMIACYKARLRIAEYLLKVGARHDKRSAKGNTALHDAAESGSVEVMRLLLNHGARLERDAYGISPLLAAALAGHQRIVDFLLGLHTVEHGVFESLCNAYPQVASAAAEQQEVIGQHPSNVRRALLVSRNWLQLVMSTSTVKQCFDSGSGLSAFSDVSQVSSPLISMDERVAAHELLGCTYVDKKRDLATAVDLWRKALELKTSVTTASKPVSCPTSVSSASKLIELFGSFGLREFETLADLAELEANPDLVRLQALLKRERLLGIAHPDTIYFVRYRGAVFADLGRFELCVQLWHYALAMQQSQLEPLSPLVQSSLLSFQELFAYMRNSCRLTLPFTDVLAVLECAVRELERSHRAMLEATSASAQGQTPSNRGLVDELGRACRAISLHGVHEQPSSSSGTAASAATLSTQQNAAIAPSGSSILNARPAAATALTSATPEWNFTRLMFVCLNLTCFLLKRTAPPENNRNDEPDPMTKEQRVQFDRLVARLVRTPTRASNRFSFMHLVCVDQANSPLSTNTLVGFSRLAVPRAPSAELLRSFLRMRANPNVADANGNKPLHVVAQQLVKLARVIAARGEPSASNAADERDSDLLARYGAYARAFLMLVDGGGHFDSVNERGESPVGMLRENQLQVVQADALANVFVKQQTTSASCSAANCPKIVDIPSTSRSLPASSLSVSNQRSTLLAALFERETLQCLAARTIRRNGIAYLERIPAHLATFVDAH